MSELRGTPRHRAEVRPRYGRFAALGSAAAVTGVAMLGGWGVIPARQAGADVARDLTSAAATRSATPPDSASSAASGTSAGAPAPSTEAPVTGDAAAGTPTGRTAPDPAARATGSEALPAGSGTGRRVVFSESAQRVWLVEDDNTVERTYLVSGSLLDNLQPGTYEVYSRSEHAWGIEDSGTMEWFVRFTRGPSGAAIGFHTIPEKDGAPLQTVAQLGTPQSHGCIRQRERDALALWDFAPIGTTVVVV